MKQKTFGNLIEALSDEPKPIGERLEALGLEREAFEKLFSKELLLTPVYGSSFLKFLQDNKDSLSMDDEIPAQPLPQDYKNPFEEESSTIRTRLSELGLSEKDVDSLFDKDVLGLNLTGGEFQDFIINNQDKFLGKLQELATKGGKNG